MAEALAIPASERLAPRRRLRVLRKLAHHRSFRVGFAIVVLLVVAALAAPVLTGLDPTAMRIRLRFRPPQALHPFGTDGFGRDVLTRVLHGARISLWIGLGTALLSGAIGAAIGVVAAQFRRLDAPLMRLMDALMAFPAILLALAVMAIAGPATVNVVVALGIAYSPRMARLTRAGVLTVRTRDYIEAVRALGARQMRIVWRHVVPNALAPIIVQGTFTFAAAILGEAALSFVGLGTVPPAPSLGNILADARPVIRDAPWMIVFPSVTLSVTILGLNLFGDGLRDVLDPRMRI